MVPVVQAECNERTLCLESTRTDKKVDEKEKHQPWTSDSDTLWVHPERLRLANEEMLNTVARLDRKMSLRHIEKPQRDVDNGTTCRGRSKNFFTWYQKTDQTGTSILTARTIRPSMSVTSEEKVHKLQRLCLLVAATHSARQPRIQRPSPS